MDKKTAQKIFSALLIIAVASVLVYPLSAEARNPFKNIFRALRRTAHFVVTLPDKATRWMGPVLGPIASAILTSNLSAHSEIGQIFRNAQRAEKIFSSIDEQNRLLASLREVYKNQANELNAQVKKMEEVRNDFKNKLLNDPEYGLKNYMRDVIALDKVIDSYRQAAVDMESTSKNLNTGDVIKMLGRDAIKDFLRGAQSVVIGEIRNEINRFVNPDIIKSFVERGDASVLDVLLDGDLSRILGSGDKTGLDLDELKERIKDRIREMSQEQRRNLRQNWQSIVGNLVNEEIKKMKENLPAATGDKKEEKITEADQGPIPKDEHGCAPGYVWQPRSGIGCVQENCNSIPSGHWSYEGYCICGSSGSINENPKDPNKECGYPPNYRACPGCLYACVHLNEDCPPPPK